MFALSVPSSFTTQSCGELAMGVLVAAVVQQYSDRTLPGAPPTPLQGRCGMAGHASVGGRAGGDCTRASLYLSLLVACGLCGTSILRRLAVLNASAVHDSQKTTHTIVLNTEPNARPCGIADASTLMCWWLLRCCWPFPHMQWQQVWQWGLCRHRGDIYSLMMVFWAVGCAVMVQCPGWLL